MIFKRLDQALRWIEAIAYGVWLAGKIQLANTGKTQLLCGLAEHWQGFRRYLLGLGPHNQERGFPSQFTFPPPVVFGLGGVSGLPMDIAAWTRSYRKTYRLSRDMSLMLAATDLDGILWRDIALPFEAFAVEFGEPICGSDGNLYDTAIVSRQGPVYWKGSIHDNSTIFSVNLLSTNIDRAPSFNVHTKDLVKRYLTNRKWKKLARILSDFEMRAPSVICNRIIVDADRLQDRLVTESVVDEVRRFDDKRGNFLPYGERQEWQQAMRVIAGLCLYLSSSASSHGFASYGSQARGRGEPDPDAIKTGAEVCEIRYESELSQDERNVIRRIAREEGAEQHCHGRRGHWRRRPGLGHLPEARKDVWVRPYIVRADRLERDELPRGDRTHL